MQVIVVGDSLHVAHHVVATLSLQNELPIIVIDETEILEKYMKKYNNRSALGLLSMAMALQGSSNPQEFETPKMMAFDQASFRYKKKNNKGNSFVSNDYLKKRKRKNRLRRQAVRKQRKK